MSKGDRKTTLWSSALPSPADQFELKRQALIKEAGRAFARIGYHNASLEGVAKMLGVTKTALYYYVRSKEEILFECKKYALDLAESARDRAISEGNSAEEKLRLWMTYYIEALTGEQGARAVLSEPISSLTEEHQQHIIKRRAGFERELRNLVSMGVSEGAFARCEPKLAVAFFMGGINGINRWYSPEGEFSGSEIASAFVRFIISGLTAMPSADLPDNNVRPASF